MNIVNGDTHVTQYRAINSRNFRIVNLPQNRGRESRDLLRLFCTCIQTQRITKLLIFPFFMQSSADILSLLATEDYLLNAFMLRAVFLSTQPGAKTFSLY